MGYLIEEFRIRIGLQYLKFILDIMVMEHHPHIIAVPYPAQGHVKPLLSFCYKIAVHGIRVTFVNAEFIHAKIIVALSDHEKGGLEQSGITLISIADGLDQEKLKEPLDGVIFTQTIRRVMPIQLRNLIERINQSDLDEPVTCVIADATLGWILEVAESVGVEKVAFVPFGPACLAMFSCIPKLIEAGKMDSSTGIIPENEQICVSKDIPPWSNRDLMWTIPGDEETRVPFLCWPYFADQLHNQKYICDIWKVGLKVNPDETGIRSRHEIKIKIKELLSDSIMKANALKFKDLANESVSKRGSSHKNFEKFINHLKYM